MIGCLINFLIFVFVFAVVGWIIIAGLGLIGVTVPENLQRGAALILGLIAVLIFLECAFGGGGVSSRSILGTLCNCPH